MAQTLPDYLAGRRRLYRRTQEAIAEAVGVSRQTVSSWEAGTTAPDLAQAILWIAALPLSEAERVEAAALVMGHAA